VIDFLDTAFWQHVSGKCIFLFFSSSDRFSNWSKRNISGSRFTLFKIPTVAVDVNGIAILVLYNV